MTAKNLIAKYEAILNQPWESEPRTTTVKLRMNKLRRLILLEGIPDEDPAVASSTTPGTQSQSSLRARVWKLLLQVPPYDPDYYLKLTQSGYSAVDGKIRDDTFRTLGFPPLPLQSCPCCPFAYFDDDCYACCSY